MTYLLGKLEREKMRAEQTSKNISVPLKYRKIAEKQAKQLEKEIDKIYSMYSKIARYEEKICDKYKLEYL